MNDTMVMDSFEGKPLEQLHETRSRRCQSAPDAPEGWIGHGLIPHRAHARQVKRTEMEQAWGWFYSLEGRSNPRIATLVADVSSFARKHKIPNTQSIQNLILSFRDSFSGAPRGFRSERGLKRGGGLLEESLFRPESSWFFFELGPDLRSR